VVKDAIHHDGDDVPEGHVLYKRASWHPWCLETWSFLAQPRDTVRQLMEKDPCCRECGLDLRALRDRLVEVLWAERRANIALEEFGRHTRGLYYEIAQGVVRAMGFDPHSSFGEADHIVPLWAGGEHLHENIQLLCQRCHKWKTRREAKLRADARKGQGRLALEN
jgi:hypothetical protein